MSYPTLAEIACAKPVRPIHKRLRPRARDYQREYRSERTKLLMQSTLSAIGKGYVYFNALATYLRTHGHTSPAMVRGRIAWLKRNGYLMTDRDHGGKYIILKETVTC